MFAVTVTFEIKPDAAANFKDAVLAQAANSLALEEACRVFDVSISNERPEIFFLYEVYDDETAFNAHLTTTHFLAFDAEVSPLLISKQVQTFSLITQAPGTIST